jgi:hypothetical protein
MNSPEIESPEIAVRVDHYLIPGGKLLRLSMSLMRSVELAMPSGAPAAGSGAW